MSKASARGTKWRAQRKRVLDRDGWTCAYCNVVLIESATASNGATVDHIEPIVLDPDRTYADAELVAACRRCNGIKAARTLVRTEWANPRWLPNGIPA